MPGKLEIKNASSSKNIIISLMSVSENETHLDSKTIGFLEEISSVVKGGVKRLVVSHANGDIFWDGIIPSYGSSPVVIHPENNTVTYKDKEVVNTLSKSNKSVYSWIFGLLIALFIIAILYVLRKK